MRAYLSGVSGRLASKCELRAKGYVMAIGRPHHMDAVPERGERAHVVERRSLPEVKAPQVTETFWQSSRGRLVLSSASSSC